MPQNRAQARKRHRVNETPSPIASKRVRKLLDDVPSPLPYRQLDLKSHQIRILHLLPGNRKDPIRCALHTALLDDGPKYEALSYTWGDPLDCRSIEVDGRRKSVTVNLYHVLRRLRYARRGRRLWVDALCINQENDIEKSHQVNLMSKIYSRTRRAILWLGDFSDGPIAKANQIPRKTATAAFALLKAMAANNHYDSGHEGGNRELADQGIPGLSCLMKLPWWHRAWTVQEALLPENAMVVCGTIQLPFSQFMQAYYNSLTHQRCCKRTGDLYSSLIQLQGLWAARDRIGKKKLALGHVLNLFRARQVSDARDRVYAYLGFGTKIAANYSLPHEEVFKLTMRSLIEESGKLESLLRLDEDNRSPTLPTWVPDWCANFDERLYNSAVATFRSHLYYRASGKVKVATRVSSSDAVLDIQGLVLDHIAAVGCHLDTPEKVKDMFSEWQDKPNTEYPRGGGYREACWRTIRGDLCKDQGVFRRLTSSDYDENMVNNKLEWLSAEIIGVTSYKRGICTHTGMIGIGNRDIQVGDAICILAGGNMPFVLRQVEGHGGGVAYQYIGQAYVHGIMDGEAMNEGRDLEWISLV
ncbi:heterokaryon incompatibility protein-domain-containing protein [Fusarium solani]|uniref:Heterokaryon incompatibility protein-domain-containing protein n=1 Tax=Fusarium solani TaxID=169388 RepID=A0A9P9KYI4_FUSSL|nr:heterokaryon incompatibility protein-domain-containing protein [Fusarium solani]KAH7270902.1 heterokaryon incompatibility protein-domain-containing protein [Fusarium solani]